MAPTDGDTWDLASTVGATATWVAAGRALATKQPDPLINDPYADALVKAVGLEFCNRMADGTLDVGSDPQLDKRRICERIAVRTRFFDDFLTEASEAAIRQAVILACGLDTRAYRLDWAADTVVFEIDQPQVIEFKTGVLADLGATPTAERRTASIDLRGDWPQALRASGFDPTRPTAWIAEGLLMYLPPQAQDRLFTVTALSSPGSRLAIDDIDAAVMSGDWAKQLTEQSRRGRQRHRCHGIVLLRRAHQRPRPTSRTRMARFSTVHRRCARRQRVCAAGRRTGRGGHSGIPHRDAGPLT